MLMLSVVCAGLNPNICFGVRTKIFHKREYLLISMRCICWHCYINILVEARIKIMTTLEASNISLLGHEGCYEDGYKTSNDSLFFTFFNSVFLMVD